MAISGFIPLTVQFTDSSTGDNLEYLWTFGDGNTSTSQNPTHEYAVAGDYTVTLRTTNNYGVDTKTDTVSVVVEPPPPPDPPPDPPPPPACFIAGTLIQLPNSTIAIEYIKVGDVVKSFDVGTSSVINSKVTETFVHSDRYYMILNGTIKTTSVHPFYSDGNWIEAGDLSIGDKILHVDGLEHTVETIELSDEPVTVYNFEVDGTHNYFAEGYLVHNKRPDF
ncbi:MAG TPA: polymorphic toxin-type HINT domain-containing protein [Candidatus Poseidoniia archaeon]|nr:polymorphic toxin-type HINT domain-containing protein [Candidatus Poseidoniia archaeon]